LLESNEVAISHKSYGRAFHETMACWKGLDNPDEFQLVIKNPIITQPFRSKCSLKQLSDSKSKLEVQLYPNRPFQILIGAFGLLLLYTLITFGIHNYPKGILVCLISVLFPAFMLGIVLLVWHLMAKSRTNNLKKEVISAFQKQFSNQ
jgi:hypothetical protein